jgi:anti-sigma regulatory factor (Ser/Thr protein kinase)
MAIDHEFVDLTLPLLPDMELTAVQTAETLGTLMEFDREKIDDVKVALCEACIHAIEDAEGGRRRVRVEFGASPEVLRIRVVESGPRSQDSVFDGANWAWGVSIIRELMDEVEVKTDRIGTTITMAKYSQP